MTNVLLLRTNHCKNNENQSCKTFGIVVGNTISTHQNCLITNLSCMGLGQTPTW
jgi:hypothetical protein